MLNCTMIYTCITGSVISSLISRSLRFHERCKTVPVSAAGFPGFGNMLCKLLQGKRQICHGLAVLSGQLCAAAIPVFMERGFLPAVAGPSLVFRNRFPRAGHSRPVPGSLPEMDLGIQRVLDLMEEHIPAVLIAEQSDPVETKTYQCNGNQHFMKCSGMVHLPPPICPAALPAGSVFHLLLPTVTMAGPTLF